MTTNDNPRPGLPKFTVDDDIVPPTPAQRAKAKVEAERIGFTPEVPKPKPHKVPARVATYTANFHIRVTAEDRECFDEFAWRHRITKGEALTRILDLALAAEQSDTIVRG